MRLSILGCGIWVLGIVTAGYFLGSFPWVKANLDKIIWGMIFVPGVIVLIGAWRARTKARATCA